DYHASAGTGTSSGGAPPPPSAPRAQASAGLSTPAPAQVPAAPPQPEPARPVTEIASLEDMVELAGRHRELRLKLAIEDHVHLIGLEPGRLECRLAKGAPADLVERLRDRLSAWTGQRWVITLSNAQGAPAIRERREAERAQALAQVREEKLVQTVLEAFPGGEFGEITDLQAPDEEESGPPADSDED
ncbi:MAG: DNA polymerase III subunit gamma/tau, partial [Alphaproteobacteria bacterium]